MDLDKCERCGTEKICGIYNIPYYDLYRHDVSISNYCVCYGCYCEWCNDDYYRMWRTLYNIGSYELANKFILDFLGKLG